MYNLKFRMVKWLPQGFSAISIKIGTELRSVKIQPWGKASHYGSCNFIGSLQYASHFAKLHTPPAEVGGG